MLTFRELEHIAETILKHTTPEEMQCYLDMEHDSKLLWIKYKNRKSGGAGMTENRLPPHLYKVFKLLPLGMDLPITGADMERLTGLDVRTIREHIRQLIVDYGIPVCGGRDNKQGGYYIPQNEIERLAGVLPLQRQYDQEHKRIHALLTADLTDWRKYRDG